MRLGHDVPAAARGFDRGMPPPIQTPERPRAGLRRLTVAAAVGVVAVPAAVASAPAATPVYAFPARQVVVQQGALSWALDRVFPALAPVTVRCWGLQPAVLKGGGKGFMTIRCTSSVNAPDWIYRLDAQGHMITTRGT